MSPEVDEEKVNPVTGTSDLAHDLKTSLAVILGYAELLLTRDDEPTRRQAAEQIHQAAEVLSARIDRLLAELESGSAEPGETR